MPHYPFLSLPLVLALATIGAAFSAGRAADASVAPSLPEAAAERFGAALRQRQFGFLTESRILAREKELQAFVARYAPASPDDEFVARLLAGIDPCVERLYGPVAAEPGHRHRETWYYIWEPDLFRTLQWHVWTALMHPPQDEERRQRLAAQHQWMVDHLATKSIHHDAVSREKSEEAVRLWSEKQLAEDRADPLSLLHDPLEPEAFAALQARFADATNGVASDYQDFRVKALSLRFPVQDDPTARYGRRYGGEHPFDDDIVDLWGNGPTLAFAANADFRGNWVHVGGPRVLDAARCTAVNLPPDGAEQSRATRLDYPGRHETMEQSSAQVGRGDVWFDVSTKIMHGLRGAQIALLPAEDWIAADAWTDHQLRELLELAGRPAENFDSLPPMNGFRRPDSRNGEFFVVIRTAEQRLAVAELRTCEFGTVELWCRPRPVRSLP